MNGKFVYIIIFFITQTVISQRLCDFGEYDFITCSVKLGNNLNNYKTFNTSEDNLIISLELDSLGNLLNYSNKVDIEKDLCYNNVAYENFYENGVLKNRVVYAKINDPKYQIDKEYLYNEKFIYNNTFLKRIESENDTINLFYNNDGSLIKLVSDDKVINYDFVGSNLTKITSCYENDCIDKLYTLDFTYNANKLIEIIDNYGHRYSYTYNGNNLDFLEVFRQNNLLFKYQYFYKSSKIFVFQKDDKNNMKRWTVISPVNFNKNKE